MVFVNNNFDDPNRKPSQVGPHTYSKSSLEKPGNLSRSSSNSSTQSTITSMQPKPEEKQKVKTYDFTEIKEKFPKWVFSGKYTKLVTNVLPFFLKESHKTPDNWTLFFKLLKSMRAIREDLSPDQLQQIPALEAWLRSNADSEDDSSMVDEIKFDREKFIKEIQQSEFENPYTS